MSAARLVATMTPLDPPQQFIATVLDPANA